MAESHVVSGLAAKRSELTGLIAHHQAAGLAFILKLANREVVRSKDVLADQNKNVCSYRKTHSEEDMKNTVTAPEQQDAAADLRQFLNGRRFGAILADPPWRFENRTGKVAPEHKRLNRYETMTLDDIKSLPVAEAAADASNLYLWVPNALLPEGLEVMKAWGFNYKSNLVWHKIRKDGGPDGRGVGFYFRNVTELILFGTRGKNARTLAPARSQVNFLATRKREHSRKPDEQYPLIEACSPGPYLELFARGERENWATWGNQADENYFPTWDTYQNHSQSGAVAEALA